MSHRFKDRTLQKVVYVVIAFVMDTWDALLRNSAPKKRWEDKVKWHESDRWSDEEIFERWLTMPKMKQTSGPYETCHVTRICSDTVVKKAYYDTLPNPESLASEFVRANTDIPTPSVRRTFVHQGEVYIVMEFIEGEELATRWPSLSFWAQLRIVWTLRGYIRQLRRVYSSFAAIPGPLGDVPHRCVGNVLKPRPRGPFADYAAMSAYFNKLLVNAKKLPYPGTSEPSAGEDVPPFDDSHGLVLVHNDLSMRNILVDTEGKLWMIDWGWSGYYPPWFEYLATVAAANNDKAPESWRRMIPLITDPSFRQQDWMKHIAVALYLCR